MIIERLTSTHDHIQYLELLNQLTNAPLVENTAFQERLMLITSNPNHHIFIMRTENTIFASITVLIEPKFIRNLAYVAHIEDVVILNEFRGKGYGRAIVEHAVNYAKEQGCYKVILDCGDDKVPFYYKTGFARNGSQMAIYF